MKTIKIDGNKSLKHEVINRVLEDEACQIELTDAAIKLINKSADYINQVASTDEVIYGVNTGFGKLAKVSIPRDKLTLLQNNLILSHAVGTGPLLEPKIVKLILLLKINSLAMGYSGIRLDTINFLVALFNKNILPCVPSKGSVGASGDLAPLAHLVLPLLGEGKVCFENKISPAKEVLTSQSLKIQPLAPKEGLALLNGTQVSTAIALAALQKIERVFASSIVSGALSSVAIGTSINVFNALIHTVRNQPQQEAVAKLYHALLQDSKYDVNKERVQSPYCIRCQPQVMGACLQQIENAKKVLLAEGNGVSDNPLVFADERKVLSGGNFHAEPIAMAADNLALSIAEIGNISERRIALLIDASISGLPAFLVAEPGINSGFMMAHVTAAALVSENKSLAHPASVDSIPTSANQEDHVSMATFAARRLLEMADNAATVNAIEWLAACQAIDLAKPKGLSKKLQQGYNIIRKYSEFYHNDRYIADEIEMIKKIILDGKLGL